MDLSKKLSLNELIPFANNKLSEIEIREIINETMGDEFSHEEGDFSFGLNASAAVSVNLINDPSDDDGDDFAQLLDYEDLLNDNAVLHYSLMASIKPNVGFEIDFFKLGLNADQKITFNNYELHKRDQKLKDAVIGDLEDYKIFLDKDHILKLEPNEAMSMSLAGQIELDAEVSWSDTLTASISSITKLLKLSETLELKVESGVKLSFSLKIKDSFQAIIKRNNNKYWVKLSKSIEKNTLAGVEAGVEVSIGNTELLETFIDQLLDNLEEELSKNLEKVLSKAVDKLTESDLDILLKAAEIFDVGTTDQATEKIMAAVAEKKKKLAEKTKKIIQAKLKLGASLSYSRVKKTESLFEANFTKEAVTEHHNKVVALKIDQLFKLSTNASNGIEIIKYEKLTQLDIKKAFKIGLSIGSFELSQEVIKEHNRSTQEVYEDNVHQFKVTDLSIGKSTYVKIPGTNQANALQMSAKMEHFIPKTIVPKCSDFDYEFTLAWKQVQKNKTKSYELRSILDLAVCWGIISPLDFEEKYREMEEVVVNSKMKGVEYEAFIKVPYEVFDLLIDDIGALNKPEIAEIFAGAVPYVDITGRRTLKERIHNYRDFWILYQDLNQATLSTKSLEDLLYDHFSKTNLTELGLYEADSDGFSNYDKYSIPNLIEHNFIGDQFKAFKSTMNRLDKRFDTSYKKILWDKTFRKNLTHIRLQQEFNMRVLGRLMLVVAKKNNAFERLEMSMEIKLSKKVNGSDKIIYST